MMNHDMPRQERIEYLIRQNNKEVFQNFCRSTGRSAFQSLYRSVAWPFCRSAERKKF